jgi:hypothetical protein
MSDQGSVYFAFIEGRLKAERDRRTTQEARAAAVVNSSAALVSLIFALVALVIGEDETFSSETRCLVIAALALFGLAGLGALMAGQLHTYEVPDDATLERCLGEQWTDTETSARLACSWMNLDTLLSLRRGNNRKSWWLDWALRAQLLALVVLGSAVGWELYDRA